MRALVVGASGQLGSDVVGVLGLRPGTVLLGVDMPQLDITDAESIAATFGSFAPDVVVNCAAWTAVDDAEANEAAARRVNGDGPRLLAEACRSSGAWLVHVSTDYVFDGLASTPYVEDHPPDPASAYGRTKFAGEVAVREVLPERHYLVRTAWLYGCAGQNFVKTMLRLESERETVEVVDDQWGQPTYSRDLARHLARLLESRPSAGTFHGTNSGQTSWFGLAREVFRLAGADPDRVRPTTSDRFLRPAPRPAYSVLGHQAWARAGIAPMRPWSDALASAFDDGLHA